MAEDLGQTKTTKEPAAGAIVIARRVILALGALLLLGLIVLILYTVFRPDGRSGGQAGFGINESGGLVELGGRQADPFTLDLFSGGSIALDDLRGQVVVLNFWASWCPPCRTEAPALNAAWRELRDQEVTFIGVDVWDERDDALVFIEEYDVRYPNGLDRGGSITVLYGIRGIPETYIIDPDGLLRAKFVGPVETPELIETVQQVISDSSE